MDEERDLVVFEDDDGNELTMEVIDYLYYEGEEYALITEYREDDECEGCDASGCNNCDNQREAFVMQVLPIKGYDENEEFVPIDEALGEKLIELFQNGYEEDEFVDDPDEQE